MAWKIILLPGMIGTADLFQPLLQVIPENVPRQIIAYPPDQYLTYSQLAMLIADQLKGQSNLVLIGESYSGALALAFAAEYPAQVRAVVLSAGFVLPPWPRWLRWFIRPWLLRIPLPLFLVRYGVAGLTASDDLTRKIRDAFRVPDPGVMTRRAWEVLTMDYTEQLLKCRVPILYLQPDKDRMVRHSSLQRIQRIRPDIVVKSVRGPHLILQAEPNQAWQQIYNFAMSLE